MHEVDVIRATRLFLRRHGLLGRQVLDLYTDAHPSLLRETSLEPFQRFTLQFDSFATHPDLVGRLADGGTTFAIEAKGETDWLKGVAQADTYRQGFHAALIAVSGTPSADRVSFARQRGVGVIAVRSEGVTVLEPPPLHLPTLALAESIQKQFTAGGALLRQFYYNLPTHYLACAACLALWEQRFGVGAALIAELVPFIQILYPTMPRDVLPALRGAEQLGLLAIRGKTIELTRIGRSCATLLPQPGRIAEIHHQALKQPLATVCQQSAAVLRVLLEQEPIAQFIVSVLAVIGYGIATPMPALVDSASRLDKALAPVVFFFPQVIESLIDDQGFIMWRKVEAQHYRTTVYMQYKRILTHAGLIADHGLAGNSSKRYRPEADLWELIG